MAKHGSLAKAGKVRKATPKVDKTPRKEWSCQKKNSLLKSCARHGNSVERK